ARPGHHRRFRLGRRRYRTGPRDLSQARRGAARARIGGGACRRVGVKGLAARLDDRFTLLTSGRRTALPRHQTLRAAMDWSYELLSATEQIILRRVAVFQGDFTIEAAAAVATDDRIIAADVFEGVTNLAAKSLISTDIS